MHDMLGPLGCHIRNGVVAPVGPGLPAVPRSAREEHPAGMCPFLPILVKKGRPTNLKRIIWPCGAFSKRQYEFVIQTFRFKTDMFHKGGDGRSISPLIIQTAGDIAIAH